MEARARAVLLDTFGIRERLLAAVATEHMM